MAALAAALVLPLAASYAAPAAAHAVLELEPATVTPGKPWRGAVRISHGCEGAPTRLVRVTMPEGVVAVKPKAHKGWLIETIWAPYPAPVEVHGRRVGEGVRSIIWKGSALPDHMYDDFEFSFSLLPDVRPVNGKLYFPVYQECEKGALSWTQVPAGGEGAHGMGKEALARPAPSLAVVASAPGTNEASDARAGASGHAAAPPSLSGGWTRATPAGAKVAGAYISIANNGAAADVLTGGRFDVAGRVEIHDMSMVDGVMRMRKLEDGLEIPAGGVVELRPGGLHVMLMDLRRPLEKGETLTGVLTFRDAGDIEVRLPVEAAGAPAPGKGAAGGRRHGHGEHDH